PSFTSFPDLDPGPSKRSSTPKDDAHSSKKTAKHTESDDVGRKDRKRKHEKRKHDALSHSKRHRSEKDYVRPDDNVLKAQEDASLRREEAYNIRRPGSPPLYFTDRKGDPLNVQYGGLHAGSVPRYYLVGWGRSILGLEPVWKVVHRGRKGVEIALGGKRRMHSLTDPSSRHLLHAPPTRRLLASSEDKYKYEEIEGFLRVTSRHDRKDDQSYRAITAPKHDANSDETESSEDEAESSGNDSDTIPMTSLQATLKSLEERLSADASSIPTWLSLLSYTLSTIPITSKNAPRARAEITLSVLSRALSAHPSNASSRTLRLRYLKAGEEIWDNAKLYAEWEDALKVGGSEIWVEWLDWRIRRGSNGIDGIVEDARRVLASIGDEEVSHMRVLWRVGVAFRDAGYVERANALFQAQAELAYHTPASFVGQPFDEQLDALEEFWEAEVLRTGEPGAKGWAHWHDTDHQAEPPAARQIPEPTTVEVDPYRRWAALESIADRTHHLPSRSFDESADADPYATILFSDIRPLLLPLRSVQAKRTFRLIWLAFLGLHIPGYLPTLSAVPSENADDRWAYGHFVSPAYLDSIIPRDNLSAATRITADAQAGVLIGREREFTSAFGPVKSWGYDVLGPLEGTTDARWRMWMAEDVAGIDHSLVREVFAQCRTGDDAEWEILSLTFEAACSAKEASRLSKTLLASAQESLLHWAAHARLERIRGRTDAARKVYQTVLAISHSQSSAATQLWWDWAEMEWMAERPDTATEVILRATGTQGTGGIAILRAKRYIQEVIAPIPVKRWKEREAWTKLWILLELLSGTPQSALSVLDSHIRALEPRSAAHESLTVACLVLLYRYGTVLRNPVPPALLREQAEAAIEAYPSNTIILGIFLEAQRGQGIWGRVRHMLGENVADGRTREKDVVRRVGEVWVAGWEKGRWEAEKERTRGGLSAAVEDERTRGSAILWRLYVEFEIRAGQLERAKKLLYRAVGECSLVKELYLLASGPLREVFSARELNEWVETMAERGIRMRRGLDELLAGYVETRQVKVEDADGEDEIEQSARELRRLMPY
ncbi:predicted protein, partial [Postia placenta Mad-698-R]